jgi:hypothetical protein
MTFFAAINLAVYNNLYISYFEESVAKKEMSRCRRVNSLLVSIAHPH